MCERTCIVDMLQMFEWYIAITSCYPFDSHRPIFRKTSKCQCWKYMVPNRRPFFTSCFFQLVLFFDDTLPRVGLYRQERFGEREKSKNMQSDFTVGRYQSTVEQSWIRNIFYCAFDLWGLLYDIFFYIIYLFVYSVVCIGINICQYSMFALAMQQSREK